MNLIEKEFSFEALRSAEFTNYVAYVLPTENRYEWSMKEYTVPSNNIHNNFSGRITTMYEYDEDKEEFRIVLLLDLYHKPGILKRKVPQDHGIVLIGGDASGYPEIKEPENFTYVDDGHSYLVRMKKYLENFGFSMPKVNPVFEGLTKIVWQKNFNTLAKTEEEKERLTRLQAILDRLGISHFDDEVRRLCVQQEHKKTTYCSIYC